MGTTGVSPVYHACAIIVSCRNRASRTTEGVCTMGGGSFDPDAYKRAATERAASGTSAFAYTDTARSAPGGATAHPTLDPRGVAFREARDSAEHPYTVPIAVMFDVTGSMAEVPIVMQGALPTLMGLLVDKGYVQHPTIFVGAVGDATSGDRVPLQVGQFEADNRIDDHIRNIFLERRGGGGDHESYELGMYFMARHTVTDAWEERGKKGYLFLIGDEKGYGRVSAVEVRALIGDQLDEDISLEAIVAELKERWEVFFIVPQHTSYDGSNLGYWRRFFGQNTLLMEDESQISSLIATTIGLAESAVDLHTAGAHLRELGVSEASIAATTTALAPYAATAAIVKTDTVPDGLDTDSGDEGSERL